MAKQFTEELALRVLKCQGRFALNPLAYRDKMKLAVLTRMHKRGVVSKHQTRVDYVEYRIAASDA